MNMNVKIIFGENGSGKTINCEKLFNLNKAVIFLERINSKDNLKTILRDGEIAEKESDSFTIDISNIGEEPFLTQKDISFLNKFILFIGLKIWDGNIDSNKILLKNLIIKKRQKRYFIWDALPCSSGEGLFIKSIILILSMMNVRSKVYIDDPLESSSYTTEVLFREFINKLKEYLKDDNPNEKTLIILTHNYSLFKIFFDNKNKMYILSDDILFERNSKVEYECYDSNNPYIQRFYFDQILNAKEMVTNNTFGKVSVDVYEYNKKDFDIEISTEDIQEYKNYLNLKIALLHQIREDIKTNTGKENINTKTLDQICKKDSTRMMIPSILNNPLHSKIDEWYNITNLESFSVLKLISYIKDAFSFMPLWTRKLRKELEAIEKELQSINESQENEKIWEKL